MSGLRKVVRYSRIYGPRRALIKALGRIRAGRLYWLPQPLALPGVGIVGCGQFAFSTIGYFVRRSARIICCYDLNLDSALSFSRMYGVPHVAGGFAEMLEDPDIDCIYVASNHASHADYAVRALGAGKRVYVEKPVAVNFDQLDRLRNAQARYPGRLFVGYNRPFAGAIRDLKKEIGRPAGPLTLSCFVSGHLIPADHWYRRTEEGTRVCGNIGHWLDLAIHLIFWRSRPQDWRVSIQWSDLEALDDNLAISLTNEVGDLVNIVLTSRTEPFEGVMETINLQWDGVIAQIDDFRRLHIWKGARYRSRRYWPKDVGHGRAILQPYGDNRRDLREVWQSSRLMLGIAEMIRKSERFADFSLAGEGQLEAPELGKVCRG
jgi:predicted dehydrogenase